MTQPLTKRKLRPWMAVTGGILMVIVAGLLLLQSPLVLNQVKRGIENAVESRLNVAFDIGKLSGNPLSGITIHDARFIDPVSETPVFAADRIQATYSLPMLLYGVFRVNQVNVDGLTANIRQVDEDYWNLWAFTPRENAGGPSDETSSFNLTVNIRELAINDGALTISVLNEDNPRFRVFRSIQCSTDLKIGNNLTAAIEHLAFDMEAPRLSVKDSSARVIYDWRNETVEVNNGSIETTRSKLAVESLIRFIPGGPEYDLAVDAANLSVSELSRLLAVETSSKGSFSGKVEFKGIPENLQHELTVYFAGSEINSHGVLDLNSWRDSGFDINGTVSRFDPAHFPFLEISRLPGLINGDFALKGDHMGLPNRNARIDVTLSASEMFEKKIDHAELKAEIIGSDLIISRLEADTPYGRISGGGNVTGIMDSAQDNRFDMAASLKGVVPASFIPNEMKLPADLNMTVTAYAFLPKSFDLEAGFARISIDMLPSTIGKAGIHNGFISALWEPHQVTVDQMTVNMDVGAVDGRASFMLNEKTCRIETTVDIPELEKIRSVLETVTDIPEIAGNMTFTGIIQGKWTSPEITISASGEQINWRDIVLADRYRLNGTWKGTPAQFDMSSTLDVAGLSINGARFSNVYLETEASQDTADVAIRCKAMGGEKLELTATVNEWQAPEKQVMIYQMALSGYEQPPLVNLRPVFIKLSRDQIEIEDMHLNTGVASLDVAGRFPLTAGGDLSLDFGVGSFDMSRISGIWGLQNVLKGTLSGQVKMQGTTAEPIVGADLTFKNCDCYGVNISEISGTMDYREGKAEFQVIGLRDDQMLLQVAGGIQMDVSLAPLVFNPEESLLDLHAELAGLKLSDIPMIKHSEANFDGKIQAKAEISGSLKKPEISGSTHLTDGFLNFENQGLTYETVEGDLNFSPGHINIPEIRITGDREGRLVINGNIATGGFTIRNFDVHLTGSDFYVPYRRGADIKVEPDIHLTGSISTPKLTGDITLTEGRVDLDLFLNKPPSEIRVIELPKAENGTLRIPDKTPKRLELIENLAADIDLIIPDDMWFRSKDQYVEIAGGIELKKDPGAQFLIYGPLNVVRGTYRFRGRLFRITQGEINFIGQERIDPPVRFRAETEINDVTIIIYLSGTFQHLNLDLDSIPAMDQVDIISYLAFGRPSSELSSEESFKAEQAALSITGQLAADELRQLLGDTLHIDYLNISAGSGDLRQGSVAMGKYVTPNVFVTYRQGFSEDTPPQVEVDYEINRHFSIETRVDEEKTAGIDFIWNLEF